jgi:hypothetical protein
MRRIGLMTTARELTYEHRQIVNWKQHERKRRDQMYSVEVTTRVEKCNLDRAMRIYAGEEDAEGTMVDVKVFRDGLEIDNEEMEREIRREFRR